MNDAFGGIHSGPHIGDSIHHSMLRAYPDDMPGKFILSVRINDRWRLEAGTDSLTELDKQIDMAVRENGPDNVRVYVLVQVPLGPEARKEELEGHHIPVSDERDAFMLSQYPDLIKEYGIRQQPGRDPEGFPAGMRVQEPGDNEAVRDSRRGFGFPDNSADHV